MRRAAPLPLVACIDNVHTGCHSGRMKKRADATYTFRLPADLLAAVKKKADEREENVSDVIRAALKRYVAKR